MKDVSDWKYQEEAHGVKFKEVLLVNHEGAECSIRMENRLLEDDSKIQEDLCSPRMDERKQDSRKKETEMEAEGVFYLTRNQEPKETFAAIIPVSQYKNPEVQAAMEDEMGKWFSFEAYETVNDEGQEAIDTRWNILRKEGHDGLKTDIKARLCLRGFKEMEKPRSDCPTVDRISNKILYTIAGNEGWNMECIDVTSAFLQGEDLDRKIFVIPP